jgi:hypothetical protein
VLITLTEHDSQDAFKNDRSTGKSVYARKGTTLRVKMASRHKVFDQMAAPVLEIMDGSLYACLSLI